MGGGDSRTLRRWQPRDVSRRRASIAVAFNVVPAIAAVAGFVLLTPSGPEVDPVLVGALIAVSALAYLAEVRLKQGTLSFFGATMTIALVALAVAGPVVALLVWFVPDLIGRFILRLEPRFSPGFVATVSSYGLAVLGGALILELAGSPTGATMAPALYSAGLAMAAINFCFARLTFAPFYQGYRPADLIRDEFLDLATAVLAMLLVGVATAVLVEPLGVFALAILASVILVPQLALEGLTRSTLASQLHRSEAMQLYVAAIADVLDLPRAERDQLACAADLIEPTYDPIDRPGIDWGRASVPGAAMLALHVGERWSGAGWPAGLPADAIPYGSRILSVARAWTDLTAQGTLELSQAEAILSLSTQADRDFDPLIVDAAIRVVADEAGFAREPGFQPKLHTMPLPRTLRRGALPTVLPRLVGSSAN